MNAYELADQLEKDWDNSYTETCNMLRQQADRIAELEKVIQNGIKAFGEMQEKQLKHKLGISISAEEYQKTHEGFSTIQEVIAKHEAIPSRKEAINKAREWLKDYRIDAIVIEPFAKPLSDEEIPSLLSAQVWRELPIEIKTHLVRKIEERHGIK